MSRVLAPGLPATLVALALLARWLLGLPWLYDFLPGAVLSPTDPVFISAILEQRAVPGLLRSVLNFESGINDGRVLPVVPLPPGDE
ncbi:MAG TPA: cation:proton antiporter [Terriglobales bacterium]|nr:cation:proton antiporter [Terriglobales bacterium]